MTEPLRLLVAFAPPDDEAMRMGEMFAKYATEVVEKDYLCAFHGERG